MMKAWLSWAALAVAGSIVLGMGACGGKVVADGITGNGGAGGAGGSSTTGPFTTTSTGPTTNSSVSVGPTSVSSGPPVCSCQAMCQDLQACGLSGPECPSYCDQIPPKVQDCVCYSAGQGCGAVEQCFSGTGPGPTTTTGGGTGGGEVSPQCADCANQQPCDAQANQCFNNDECQALIDCASGCNWTFGCLNGCASQHPNGVGDFSTLVNCAICGSCYNECASSSLAGYCFDGG